MFLFVIIDEFRFHFIGSSRKHTRWSCLCLWNKISDYLPNTISPLIWDRPLLELKRIQTCFERMILCFWSITSNHNIILINWNTLSFHDLKNDYYYYISSRIIPLQLIDIIEDVIISQWYSSCMYSPVNIEDQIKFHYWLGRRNDTGIPHLLWSWTSVLWSFLVPRLSPLLRVVSSHHCVIQFSSLQPSWRHR